MKPNRQNLSLLATLLIAVMLFLGAALRYHGFFTLTVFVNLFDDNAFLGIAAVAMTFVILSGGIDLSIGSMIGLASILSAVLVERYHLHPALAAVLVLAVGALSGATMGFLIVQFDIAPFLVTLAGMFFLRGLAYVTSLESIPLNHPSYQWLAAQRLNLGTTFINPPCMIFLLVLALGWFFASSTRFGRSVYAVGGSASSASLMGIRVDRTILFIYILSGILGALAGVVYTIYTNSGNATAATGLELDAIAAVVIGGTLLSGGRGSIGGTLLGVLILGTIQTIITFEATLNSWWTRIVIGALLFVFVMMQRLLDYIGTRKLASAALTAAALIITSQAQANACPQGWYHGAKVQNGLYQMTGLDLVPGQTDHALTELPDPAPPYETPDGHIEIYGSTSYFIRYPNWRSFLRGGCYQVIQLDLRTPTGAKFPPPYAQPWDVRKFRVEGDATVSKTHRVEEVMVGGAMTATHDRPTPIWPDDNITRRIYFFRANSLLNWTRDILPIVGDVATGWIGHSYGGNLLQEGSPLNVIRTNVKNAIGFFYEKVSDDTGNGPFKTEIFAKQITPFANSMTGEEIPIFTIGQHPYPSTQRTGGGYLAEGPRPAQVKVKGQTFYVIGFSSGDFPTDNYTINYLWSRSLFGPYQPKLNAAGTDLLDLGLAIKKRYQLSWMGRPTIFRTPNGNYQMLFHAVKKSVLPDNDYSVWPTKYNLWDFFRCIFKVDVEFSLDDNADLNIQLHVKTAAK